MNSTFRKEKASHEAEVKVIGSFGPEWDERAESFKHAQQKVYVSVSPVKPVELILIPQGPSLVVIATEYAPNFRGGKWANVTVSMTVYKWTFIDNSLSTTLATDNGQWTIVDRKCLSSQEMKL
jgi:hypothetical protein